jgi:hypothetical protein
VVSRDVALTASFDPFVIASLPLQNFITTYATGAAVFAGAINPLNAAWAAFAKGDIAAVNTALGTIIPNEVTAIANVIGLPAKLIQMDLAAIGFVSSAMSSASTLAKADVAAADVSAAAVDPVTGLLAIASLPLQNFIATYSAFAAVAAGLINPLNAAWAAFAAGNIPGIATALSAIPTNEATAIANLIGLPAKIITQDIATILGAFGVGAATEQTALSANSFAAESAADVSAAAVDPITGLLAVASLPLQNFNTTYATLAAVAGGVITPLNQAWAAFAAGNISGATAALSTIAANEAVAIGNLLGLPAKIIAQDVATIVGALGGGAAAQTLGAEEKTFSLTAGSSEDQASGDEDNSKGPALQRTLQLTAGHGDDEQEVDGGADGAGDDEQGAAGGQNNANGASQGAGDDKQGQPGDDDNGQSGDDEQGESGDDNQGQDGKQGQPGAGQSQSSAGKGQAGESNSGQAGSNKEGQSANDNES